MNRLLTLCLLPLLASAACYSERLPPPTFRHSCGQSSECGSDEACVNGLCQIECTLATANEDCSLGGQGASFIACINGVCTSACQLNDDICPGEQACTEIPVLSDQLGAGVCMQECSDDSCPDGEACLEGFCAQTCDPTDPASCADGQICLAGFCAPEEIAETSLTGESATTETATDGDTEGDTE
ncbi:MAG: hypothetical protein AAGA54_06700 [Myxococcota bacterium]